MPVRASCARGLPGFQILPTSTQLTAAAAPFNCGGSPTAQPPLAFGEPEQDPLLKQPKSKVECEAEQADDDYGEIDQSRVERVAGHRNNLPEAITDAGGLGDQHDHPCGEQIETKHD